MRALGAEHTYYRYSSRWLVLGGYRNFRYQVCRNIDITYRTHFALHPLASPFFMVILSDFFPTYRLSKSAIPWHRFVICFFGIICMSRTRFRYLHPLPRAEVHHLGADSGAAVSCAVCCVASSALHTYSSRASQYICWCAFARPLL